MCHYRTYSFGLYFSSVYFNFNNSIWVKSWQEGSVSEDTMTWSLPSPTRDPIEYTQTKEAFDAQQAATPPAP